jgi:hypothetical protein
VCGRVADGYHGRVVPRDFQTLAHLVPEAVRPVQRVDIGGPARLAEPTCHNHVSTHEHGRRREKGLGQVGPGRPLAGVHPVNIRGAVEEAARDNDLDAAADCADCLTDVAVPARLY